MSAFRSLAACALLAATAARAGDPPPTVEASPRFVDLRARFGLGIGVGGAGPLVSATAIFGPLVAVDLSGMYYWTGMSTTALFGALQAGPNFRFGSRNAEGAGNVTDVRLLAGADVSTAELLSEPPRTVYVPGFVCSAATEWTHWFGSWLGLSGELAATGAISSAGGGVYLRASVGLAF
jgi:hypothetical protein